MQTDQGNERLAEIGDELYGHFDELAEQMAESRDNERWAMNEKTRKGIADAGSLVVEMRRLELLTPYMRSKFVADGVRSKTTSKGRKRLWLQVYSSFQIFPIVSNFCHVSARMVVEWS